MSFATLGKISVPIVSAVLAFLGGGEYQHLVAGLSLGFLIDAIWLLVENKKALVDINESIMPLHELIDYPLKRIDKRRQEIERVLDESDEVFFVTTTGTGWLTDYVRKFETRLDDGGKRTVFLVLDPLADDFDGLVNDRERWRFDPSMIRLPYQFTVDGGAEQLRKIDRKFSGNQVSKSEHFRKKYCAILGLLEDRQTDSFQVVKMLDLPAANLIFSRTSYGSSFYAILKNSHDSTFDFLAKIDDGAGEIFDLYRGEFEKLCQIYKVAS